MQTDFQRSTRSTIQFIKGHCTVLIIVAVIAAVVSAVVAFAIPPLYRSTVTVIPSNSNRMSKAILAERYSMDFMDYGSERDCEYAIQILTSGSMEDSLMRHFNLPDRYRFKEDDPYRETKTRKRLQRNMNVKRTNFMGVEIAITDHDPVVAAEMANFVADYYDTLCHRIQLSRAQDAYNIMHQLCLSVGNDIAQLEDSMRANPQHKESLSLLIADKCQQLASLQTRTSQTKVDMEQHIDYKFAIDQARPADKKYKPKRLFIILGGIVSALALCILLLVAFDGKDESVKA